MTEYATTPSAIEEWKTQRSRTSDWVQSSAVVGGSTPGAPPSPDDDSDFEKRSLWDGGGWEAPSDCESATSVPPTMMLQYPDARQVVVTPTPPGSHMSENNGSRTGTRRSRARTREEERTERARSARSMRNVEDPAAPVSSVPKSMHEPTVVPSHTSSGRLARAAAAPLPDSHSSSSGSGSAGALSASKNSVHSAHVPSVVAPSHHSHVPSHHSQAPSHHSQAPLHHSIVPSRHSQAPSHHSQAPSHHSQHTYVPSHHSQAPSAHPPPSAFSTHTTVIPPAAVNAAPSASTTSSSIHSRAISLADSRSSGPPEPIVIHPPTVSSSRSHTGALPPGSSHTANGSVSGNGNGLTVYPQMYVPSTTLTTQSVPPAAHVALPPPSTASASLSYYSTRHNGSQRQSGMPSYHPSHVNQQVQTQMQLHSPTQLPTPVSPASHQAPSIHSQASLPMKATSSASTTGLGGGFVLVDAPPGEENDPGRLLSPGDKKGSLGNKSTNSQRRERGSLFGVFGGGKGASHNRSKSLPLSGMEGAGTGAGEAPGSPMSQHSQQPNPYLTPVSPISPVDPVRGPNPPSIVYAPARHHRATHYAPPRIMYMPAPPRGQRHAPYDTQQLLGADTYAQYGAGGASPGGYVPAPGGGSPGGYVPGEHALPQMQGGHGSPRSARRSRTVGEGSVVRDSGWVEGKREGSSVRHERGISAAAGAEGDYVAHDYAHSPRVGAGGSGSPSQSHAIVPSSPEATHAQSDATSARSNIAGIGTVSGRSRSRGRTQEGGERPRSRSRSRGPGIVYSVSAPQPAMGGAPPHAAMMVPPSSTHQRGIRETPYPTPPGSANENHQHAHAYQASGASAGVYPHMINHRSVYVPPAPAPVEASPGPGGLISRFRDIYLHPSHGAAAADGLDRNATLVDPGRGRARERRKKGMNPMDVSNANGRARSVDSEASHSSASTYYVIPTPGQKVRIIRTDGRNVTTTTSVSRHASTTAGGGWLKKAAALRPRFKHRDQNSQPPIDPAHAPTMSSRTPSNGTGRSGQSGKKSTRKLVRRNSTGSAALLSISQQGSAGRDVDVVIPGR